MLKVNLDGYKKKFVPIKEIEPSDQKFDSKLPLTNSNMLHIMDAGHI